VLVQSCVAHGYPQGHVIRETFRLLSENHIKIVAFAPDTTDICWAFDFSFFSVFKTTEKFWMDQGDDMTLKAAIHTLVRQFHSAATPENIHEIVLRFRIT
jgi:hypothetical protein